MLGIGLKERNVDIIILQDLQHLVSELDSEKAFLRDGCQQAKETYEDKRKKHNIGEQSLFALAWEVDGFEKLMQMQDDILSAIRTIEQMIASPVRGNVPKKLTELRKVLEEYVKGVAMKNMKQLPTFLCLW